MRPTMEEIILNCVINWLPGVPILLFTIHQIVITPECSMGNFFHLFILKLIPKKISKRPVYKIVALHKIDEKGVYA